MFCRRLKQTLSSSKQIKETIEVDGTKIYFMNYADLIQDKEATARKKDFEDIEQLKKLREK